MRLRLGSSGFAQLAVLGGGVPVVLLQPLVLLIQRPELRRRALRRLVRLGDGFFPRLGLVVQLLVAGLPRSVRGLGFGQLGAGISKAGIGAVRLCCRVEDELLGEAALCPGNLALLACSQVSSGSADVSAQCISGSTKRGRRGTETDVSAGATGGEWKLHLLTQQLLRLRLGPLQEGALLFHRLGAVQLLPALGSQRFHHLLSLCDLRHVHVAADDLLQVLQQTLLACRWGQGGRGEEGKGM